MNVLGLPSARRPGFSRRTGRPKGQAKGPGVPVSFRLWVEHPLRLLPIGLLALTAVTVTGVHSLASAQGIASHDTKAPVQLAADQIELQDRQNRVVLSGDVVITQGDLTLRAPRTTVAYTDNGQLEIQRLDATGGVTVSRGRESASGAVAVYDFNKRLITMSGGVTLRRNGDTLNGGRLVIDLRTGLASIDGRANAEEGGRVTGTFSVPQ